MRKICVLIVFIFIFIQAFTKNTITITKNDSTQLSGVLTNYTDRKVLSSPEVLYFNKDGKEESIKAFDFKEFIVNNTDYFEVINYNGKRVIAQLISQGKYILYEIITNGERRYLLATKDNPDKFAEIRKQSMKGLLNYYFKDCPSYADTTKIKNQHISFNSISLAKELAKYHKCIQQPNQVFVKDEKAEFYGNVSAGIQLVSLKFNWKGSELYKSHSKVALGYGVGVTISSELKKRVSIDFGINYVATSATISKEEKNTFPVNFSYLYDGQVKLSGIDIPLLVKGYFLTKKVTPYAFLGTMFSYRIKSEVAYTKTSTFDNQQTKILLEDEVKYSIGLNIGVGVRYKIVPSVAVFYDISYKMQVNFKDAHDFSENHFYTGLGVSFRFNNPAKKSKIM